MTNRRAFRDAETQITAGRLAMKAASIAQAVRGVLGAPDYELYLRHLQEQHPDMVPLTREEFVRERMENRYNKPGSRCC